MGGLDLVIDDGSHIAEHQRKSFETPFPLLNDSGLYLAKDVHTSYWPGFHQGGYRSKGTFIETAKTLIDHMHHWYHNHPPPEDWMRQITAVHFYDSVIVIEKGQTDYPVHAKIGTPSYWQIVLASSLRL